MSSLHSVDSERGVVADAQAQAPVITEGDGTARRSDGFSGEVEKSGGKILGLGWVDGRRVSMGWL